MTVRSKSQLLGKFFTPAEFAAESRRIQAEALRKAADDIHELREYGFTTETSKLLALWLQGRAEKGEQP